MPISCIYWQNSGEAKPPPLFPGFIFRFFFLKISFTTEHQYFTKLQHIDVFWIGHWACYVLNKCKSTLLHLLNFEVQPSPVAAHVFNLPYFFEFISPLTITNDRIPQRYDAFISAVWCYYEFHLHHEVCKPLKYSDQANNKLIKWMHQYLG